MTEDVIDAVQGLRPIADDLGVSMSVLAVAWILHQPAVTAAIVGGSKPEQIAENVKATEAELSSDVLRRIDEVLAGVVIR